MGFPSRGSPNRALPHDGVRVRAARSPGHTGVGRRAARHRDPGAGRHLSAYRLPDGAVLARLFLLTVVLGGPVSIVPPPAFQPVAVVAGRPYHPPPVTPLAV